MDSFDRSVFVNLASMVEAHGGVDVGCELLRRRGVEIPSMLFWSIPRQEQWVARKMRELAAA